MATKVRKYRSEDIIVTYNLKRCIHAAECVHGLPAVFDVNKRPWVQPDQANADAVAAVVMACPTGALKFERQDGGAAEPVPEKNTVIVAANGPLYIHGDVQMAVADGSQQETRVALCRCGDSNNKPFCDNTHIKAGFADPGEIGESRKGAGEYEADGGPLNVKSFTNGPLFLQGNFEIQSADGQTIFQGSKTALCRCGGSQNKPFCDGMHKQIGFTAE